MVYSVLVVHCHELEHHKGCCLLVSNLVQCWRHIPICRVFKGGDNAFGEYPKQPVNLYKLWAKLRVCDLEELCQYSLAMWPFFPKKKAG